MKKLYILFILPFLALGQSQDQNYIRTTTYKVATGSAITNPTAGQAVVQVSYFDGLGRPLQQVAHKQASNGGDIIVPIDYDNFGRQVKEYLPYVRTSGSKNYDTGGIAAVSTFYATNNVQNTGNPSFATTQYPYSQKELEPSPLNRVFKQAAPGDVWRLGTGKEIKFDYQTNGANEVRYFKAQATWNTTFELYSTTLTDNVSFYVPNELYKTITKDENWMPGSTNNTTEEFKNKLGQVVLKRTYTDVTAPNGAVTLQVKHDTYYVYDDYGNLTYVIPPLTSTTSSVSANDINGLCYQYRYDKRNRLVEKKLPGKDWEYIVYDKLDRPVLTGPALNPITGTGIGWMVTKYDVFNRVVYTAWVSDTTIDFTKRKTLQSQKNAETAYNESKTSTVGYIQSFQIQYTNTIQPYSNLELLTINYYDTYDFPDFQHMVTEVEGQDVQVHAKGLTTSNWVRVLTSTMKYEVSYFFYDNKARLIRNHQRNYFGGFAITDFKLNFSGQPTYTITNHQLDGEMPLYTIREDFEYTDQGRLLNHYHKINEEEMERLTTNVYDNLGQLITKGVGGSPSIEEGLQKLNYTYNIRGWLTQINDVNQLSSSSGQFADLFAFKINYNDVQNTVGGDIKPLFNGNISETFWRTQGDDVLRKYGYKYDQLNRLQRAVYQKPDEANQVTNSYNEHLWYDKNGNILKLNRTGDLDDYNYVIDIDQLTYTYHPTNKNQLMKVFDLQNNPNGFKDDGNGLSDPIDDYNYDTFGNMTRDDNKGITQIRYNHLNLPIKITFTNGIIDYLYNAVGVKLQKKVTQGSVVTTTDYQNGFQYVKEGANDSRLEFFPHAEGYVKVSESVLFNYVYNYTDHLGNIRLSYSYDSDSNDLKILEENHYYPFGLKHKNYNVDKRQWDIINQDPRLVPVVSMIYKYKYNGKEFQDELGLNFYDYGARNYDPALGRWMNVDPLAERLPFASPYAYCLNNPIVMVDPDGQYPIYVVTRSYAPFKTFGPSNAWHGDGRGHTLNRSASYRTWAGITHDTETRRTTATGGMSRSYTTDGTKDASSRTKIDNRSSGENIDVHSYGNNAAQTGSWDIDQFTKLEAKIEGNVKKDHVLSVSGTISGDDFPNQESFIYDAKGNALWLGNFETTGDRQSGPVTDLPRKNEDDVNINVNVRIKVDKNGIFQGVMQTGKDGKETMISIGDWNKKFKSDDNK